MARPLRMDYPDMYYHVLSRGNERRDIFYDDGDYFRFLETLDRMVARFNIEVHAYVLMRNHYHLLVRTIEANLSRAIQWLGVSYSVWYNRRHRRTGHLFQGRFKSFLIENERYLVAMGLYIHGNPMRAGVVDKLSEYPWSSYRAYAGMIAKPSWLTTDEILDRYGGSRTTFVQEQQAYLERNDSILDDLHHGLYLGSNDFAQECVQRIGQTDHRETPQFRSLVRDRDIRVDTLEILRRLGEKDPESLLAARRPRSLNRDLGIYILYQLGVYRNEEIGRVFGIGYTAVTAAVNRVRRSFKDDIQLEMTVKKILSDK
jgi:putative transposase